MGVLFFTWTDNWQVYTDPLRELYNRGVQLAGGARMGHTSEPGQQDGTVSGGYGPGRHRRSHRGKSDTGSRRDIGRYADRDNDNGGTTTDRAFGRTAERSGLPYGG